MTDVWEAVEHHYADNNGTKIHYVTLGEGEPIIFVHGFPDFWYSWAHQMEVLSPHYKTIAIDNRAYNQSDKPEGIENYQMEHLLGDILAVINDLGLQKINLVGHDWGGVICWQFTMHHQELVERLVILNLTHPKGYSAVVANPTPEQQENVQYARNFASSEPNDDPVPEQVLAIRDKSSDTKIGERYREALSQSYWSGMTNYYRANYGSVADQDPSDIPDITCPVLQFHGLLDTAVDKDGLNNTWNWITEDYTLVTTPKAGHFVQWEAADLVSDTMKWWFQARM
jgi:pimeloyl-ACP methyl ester carboxylesterase